MNLDLNVFKRLIDIGKDIIQKKETDEYGAANKAVNISISIIKENETNSMFGFLSNMSLPEQTLRFKNIEISIENRDYYDKDGNEIKPEENQFKLMTTIIPVYDESKIQITTYKIMNGENGENIVDELDLGEIKLEDLIGENKENTIKNIIEKLKNKYNVEDTKFTEIKEYLDKLGKSANQLKINVEGLDQDVDTFSKKYTQ